MAFALVGFAAFGVSALTLFSGFGLGALLMPVFTLFFPVPVTVASTAVVHAANNLFKVAILGRRLLPAVTVGFVRSLTGGLLVRVGLARASGLA